MRNLNQCLARLMIFVRSAFFTSLPFLMLTSTPVQAQSPHFGSNYIFLEGWNIILSPQSGYAAGLRWQAGDNLVEIRLWDIQNNEITNSHTLEPSANIVLEHKIPPGLVTSIELQFSPDEQYLAVRKDFDLTILTVPDLQIHTAIKVSTNETVQPDSLTWSKDSSLLSTQGSGDLVILDVQSGELLRHKLDNTLGPIIALNEGWLTTTYVWYDEQPITNAFSFCSRLAEVCAAYGIAELLYPVDGQPVVASPD